MKFKKNEVLILNLNGEESFKKPVPGAGDCPPETYDGMLCLYCGESYFSNCYHWVCCNKTFRAIRDADFRVHESQLMRVED